MKVCTTCQKNYGDDALNFCLDCGNVLTQSLHPTMPDLTKPSDTNWQEQKTIQQPSSGNPGFSNNPFSQGGNMGWTPPPAPLQGWQNQGLGSNTPFQPPPIGMQGRDQNLSIAAMILGILSVVVVCCASFFGLPFGIGALITGYLAIKNINHNPTRYSGKELAIVGLVTGGVGTLISLGSIIFILIAILASK